jgi:hypothetical protein
MRKSTAATGEGHFFVAWLTLGRQTRYYQISA